MQKDKKAPENELKAKRKNNFDILKCMCAFLIVCIHAPFPGIFGEYFTALTRIAVPIFFMITGFFYKNTVKKSREVFQIKKIAFLFVTSNVLYFLLMLNDGMESISSIFTVKSILSFLFLNASPFSDHLWYLGAILYTLIIVYILNKAGKIKILYILTPLLLLGDLILGKYSLLLFGNEFPYVFVRNFLFVGIPYFCIGMLIFQYRDIIKRKLSKTKLIICTFTFSVTTILERFILESNNLNAARDHYISTTFLAVCLFILFMISFQGDIKFINKLAAKIGREYSTGIYILHPLIIRIFNKLINIIGFETAYAFVQPIIVFIFTTVAVAVICFIIKKLNIKKWVRFL